MSRSVSNIGVPTLGGRIATGLAILGVASAATLATFDTADARSKKRVPRLARPAVAAATFTGAANYAALVVDAKTGRTLYEKNADAIRFPASVTKVMTLYLVFEDLERGRIRLDTRMTMSSECASRAPSKLGLRPGQTIDVEDGIKALVTKSANDVACAFGDNLEGSEGAFAERMTRKARAIGMSSSVFRNASGLPNGSHVTTARDLVTLGRAIQDRFPRYYGYFGTRVFNFAGRAIGNHNKLLGRVEGVDGIKTGYTNASGFNLLSSVKSNGRSIVAVVMGGRSGPSRDAHMQQLIAMNLPKAQPGSRTAPLVADASEREPVVRSARPAVMASVPTPLASPLPGATRVASLDAVPLPAPAPAPMASGATPKPEARVVEARMSEPRARAVPVEAEPVEAASVPVPAVAAAPAAKPMRWVVGAAPTVTGSVASDDEPRAQLASATVPTSVRSPRSGARDVVEAPAPVVEQPARKGWMIQIGATTEAGQAEALLSDAKSKAGRALTAAEPFTETFTKGATTYYRARFAGLNEQSADAACKALKRSSVSCFAIKN